LGEKGLVVLDEATGDETQSESLPAGGPLPSELLLAGGSLLVTNLGPECRLIFFRTGEKLVKEWECTVQGGCLTPSLLGRNLFLRSGKTLYALGGLPPRKPEAENLPVAIGPPEGFQPAQGVPLVNFENNQMPTGWLICGPFKPKSLETDFLKDMGGREKANPAAGAEVKSAEGDCAFWALNPKFIWQDAKFTGGYQAYDLRDAIGKVDDCTLYLYTVLDNPATHFAEMQMLTPKGEQWNPKKILDYAIWMGGKPVKENVVIQLLPGKIPILIQVTLGAMKGAGKIWMAPRFLDRTPGYAGILERHQKALAAWEAFQKAQGQVMELKP
jgi:hypothetical protein